MGNTLLLAAAAASRRRTTFDPNTISGLLGRESGVNVFSDTGLTTPAVNGDLIAGHRAAFATAWDMTQPTSGERPQYQASPPAVLIPGGGARRLVYGTGLVMFPPWTVYFGGRRAAGTTLSPFGSTNGNRGMSIYADNSLYIAVSGDWKIMSVSGMPVSPAPFACRVRQRVSDSHVMVKMTGLGEVDLGQPTGTNILMSEYLGWWNSSTFYTDAGNEQWFEYASPTDLIASGEDVGMQQYIPARWGVSL